MRPWARAWPSLTARSNQRWANYVTYIYCGRDGWCHMPVVIDCTDREIFGWVLFKSGKATVPEVVLEDALIRRVGPWAQRTKDLFLRSDKGLAFVAKPYRQTVNHCGLSQQFITPYTPEQKGVIERVFRSLKEECIRLHRFESRYQAELVIVRWIEHYETWRPHEALGRMSPTPWQNRKQQAA